MAESISERRFKQIVEAAKRIKEHHNTVESCRDEADFILCLALDAIVQVGASGKNRP